MSIPCVILCTGGIGSGKSCVVKAFNIVGVPSYDCDSAAKNLYDTDPLLLEQVVTIAGGDVIKEGRLDRKALASKIFSNPQMLRSIEAVVHPAVIRDFDRWKASQTSDIVIIESAIMLEKPVFDEVMDWTVAICAPEDVRVGRVMERDRTDEASVRRRLASQWTDARRAEKADFIINTDDRQEVLPAILNIIETVRNGKNRS